MAVTGRGGARPNAGRKPGSKNRTPRELKDQLIRLADDKVVGVLETLLEDRDARVRMEAARELLNRVLGRPKEDVRVEHGVNVQSLMEALALKRLRAVAEPPSALALPPVGGQAAKEAESANPTSEGPGLDTRRPIEILSKNEHRTATEPCPLDPE